MMKSSKIRTSYGFKGQGLVKLTTLLKEKKRSLETKITPKRMAIDTDRSKNIGHLYLRDGDVPVRILTEEEKKTIPMEIWNNNEFRYPIGFPWDPVRYQLACGFPICYFDKSVSGKIVERHADGKIYECLRDEQGKSYYKFLRMATPEDDARAGIEREADHRRAGERMKQILELGLNVRYKDLETGDTYERRPDRKIYRIEFEFSADSDEVVKQTPVFLRDATPEDDAIYGF